MTYERTVAAAIAETKSKFELAEALAEEILPRKRGPKADEDVQQYLAEARQKIIDAGGESRGVKTLKEYRETGLWVWRGNPPNYAWVHGYSFTAHNEARKAGLSYDEFAAEPRTTDRIRRDAGKAGTDGPPEKIIEGWTPKQRQEAAQAEVPA